MGISYDSLVGGTAVLAGVLTILQLARNSKRINFVRTFTLALPAVLCILFGLALLFR